jgi:phenylpropionate dioxygenase-like ring-hydroxylating dioxygenase large terminal subunit
MRQLQLDPGSLRVARRDDSLEGDGFHSSWYPVALASEVAPGKILSKDVLGTRVVVYRDAAGKLLVQSAWCPHLGADLSVGDIVDGRIRCAYHHWTFDGSGTCVHIPTGDKIPPGAKITTFPSAEAWGLVWIFNGETPMFDLPRIPGADESELIYETRFREVLPIEPWMARTNGVDFQHLRSLHGLPAIDPDMMNVGDYTLEYRIGREAAGYVQHGLITGTNTFAQHVVFGRNQMFMLFTGAPIDESSSTYFYAVGARKAKTDAGRHTADATLKAVSEFADRLYADDAPILKTMRFRKGVLVATDRHLARFLKFVSEFPRTPRADA